MNTVTKVIILSILIIMFLTLYFSSFIELKQEVDKSNSTHHEKIK